MSEEQTQEKQHWIVYPIGSKPKWGLAILLGIQQYLTMFGATVLIPFIVGGAMGLPPDQLALLISTIFFTSGLCTLIQQSPLGNKLPVVQGGTFSFLGPTFAILGMVTAEKFGGQGPLWQIQIQHVAGAIMIASVFEIVLGYTGIMGQVRKLISPITIGPTIAMIGLALFSIGAPWMASNWIISLITLISLIVYSQVLSQKSRVFMLFPVLLAIATGWLAAMIGSVTGMISPDSQAYLKTDLIGSAAWFSLMPMMPFKWGFPDLGSSTMWAGAFGMLAGYMASMIESIGDYYACARISEAPVPTSRMISRGLGAEGLGCFVGHPGSGQIRCRIGHPAPARCRGHVRGPVRHDRIRGSFQPADRQPEQFPQPVHHRAGLFCGPVGTVSLQPDAVCQCGSDRLERCGYLR